MGLLELPDLRHTLVDIGTTLFSRYNGLPGRTLNLIHETPRRSERVDFMQLCQVLFHTKCQAK